MKGRICMQALSYEIVPTLNPIGLENCIIKTVSDFGSGKDRTLHWHHALEITLILEGGIDYLIEGKQYRRNAGEFMLINSGSVHQTQNATKTGLLSVMILVIPDSFLRELVPEIVKPQFDLDQNPTVRDIIATYLYQINTYLQNPKPFQSLLIRKELLSVLYQLYSKCYVKADSRTDDNQMIKEITRYVEKHYAEELALEKVAELFHLQKNYFCRFFKKKTGLSFHQYLCQVRVHAALALLSSGEGRSVLECALESGFSSGKILNDWCQKLYGCTPLQYIEYLK